MAYNAIVIPLPNSYDCDGDCKCNFEVRSNAPDGSIANIYDEANPLVIVYSGVIRNGVATFTIPCDGNTYFAVIPESSQGEAHLTFDFNPASGSNTVNLAGQLPFTILGVYRNGLLTQQSEYAYSAGVFTFTSPFGISGGASFSESVSIQILK